ncbi:tRNA (adenosine(37)-N6)-dimethylallyltransferase MiaA [Amaricoccus sp.]|uniref:tRNA (adenosine(37)-N6)-dimethylallyltransferase MiaA n=1 Tax=Amaricoccus sp. TaxID=1872485 RepID=UPI002633158B|nr:tRNA (adenosine(37)-N6)-dimethylallyltransferase MiaA [Amaricoccus sp.]HRO09895.1 tRNA (adenosine(37)-N6)-dimethylallyltransferase MiaA [Amaricoccus sp.]
MAAQQRPVLIAGPTASGKSALALALAERGGVVINADAFQVYACWRVLSARPEARDLARAPHRLYGHVACDRGYSVGDWLRDVRVALDDAARAGLRPIVVGGTGLYFHALTAGLAAIPPIPPEIRALARSMPLAELRAGLDPETAARIDLDNPVRVQRAWEVFAATGRGLVRWQAETGPPVVAPESAERILLDVEKDTLNINIERRFAAMLEHGAIDEVRSFTQWSQQSAQVIGAKEIRQYLLGETSRESATAAAVTATRQFAKRQRTWFRSRMTGWRRIIVPDQGLTSIS